MRIVNVIASTRIGCSIDIEKLSERFSNSRYDPEIFSGLIYRKSANLPTVIMFASGKISSHGAKSETKAKNAITSVIEEIEKNGCIMGTKNVEAIKIENIVATADCKSTVNLSKIHAKIPNSKFKDGNLNQVIFRPNFDSLVFMLFSTGKITIAGGKSESQVQKACKEFCQLINSNIA